MWHLPGCSTAWRMATDSTGVSIHHCDGDDGVHDGDGPAFGLEIKEGKVVNLVDPKADVPDRRCNLFSWCGDDATRRKAFGALTGSEIAKAAAIAI